MGILIAPAVALLCHPPSLAVCPQPDPTVCAEYFKRDLVFIGTVRSEDSVLDEEGFVEGWTYRVRVRRVLRGRMMNAIEVFTENSSGRFPLMVGQQYLLFADRSDGRWAIDNCGNSGLMSESKELIREIETFRKSSNGVIRGHIAKRSSWTGLSGVDVSVRGSNGNYNAVTNRDGWFEVKVPPGQYSIVIGTAGVFPFDLSYYDPAHLVVPRGGCALVQFVAENE